MPVSHLYGISKISGREPVAGEGCRGASRTGKKQFVSESSISFLSRVTEIFLLFPGGKWL